MNLDKTFCTSETCEKYFFCERHVSDLKRFLRKMPQFKERVFSHSDFTPAKDKNCEYFIEKDIYEESIT